MPAENVPSKRRRTSKKQPKGDAERKRLSRARLKQKVTPLETEKLKLTDLKKQTKICEKRLRDTDFDTEFRKRAAERVAMSRLKKKLKSQSEAVSSTTANQSDELVPPATLASQPAGLPPDPANQPAGLPPQPAGLPPHPANENAEIPTPRGKTRQFVQGLKRRRETLRDKNVETEELQRKIIILENEINKVEEDNLNLVRESLENRRKIEKLEEDKKSQFDWLKVVWKYSSSGFKSELKTTLTEVKDELPRGTLRGLRDGVGINFSNPLTAEVSSRGSDLLRTKIEEFANDNSFEMPDIKHANKKVRFMRHWKTVLHGKFLSENPTIECHYSTFCFYFPKNIKKPGRDYKGTCLCEDCENFSLKDEALKREKVSLNIPDVEAIIKAARDGNIEPEEDYLAVLTNIQNGSEKGRITSYFEWRYKKENVEDKNGNEKERKTLQRESIKVSIETLARRMLLSYKSLKEHLDRDFTMRKYIKVMRQRSMEDSSMACLTVDWSENGVLVQCGEVQSAYFSRPSYSIHSGYCYRFEHLKII